MAAPPRRAERLRLFGEWIAGMTVLFVLLPPLYVFFAFLSWKFTQLASPHPMLPVWQVAVGWIVLLVGTWVFGGMYIWGRLQQMRDALPHRETKDFALFRIAKGINVDHARRTMVGPLEVTSFDARYISAKAAGPVITDAESITSYRHAVYFCILPGEVPPFRAFAKQQVWEGGPARKHMKGADVDAPDALADRIRLQAHRPAEVVARLSRPEVVAFFDAHPDWCVEVRTDRLLAYRVSEPRDVFQGPTEVRDEDVQAVAALAEALV